MTHDDHVALLRDGIPGAGVWADLGSGEGAFTLALADLLGPSGRIYSVDRDGHALARQARTLGERFPAVAVESITGDFTRPLALPPLDGVVMANSLHFAREHEAVIRLVWGYLAPGGRLIVVEYNTDRGNPWVPYPLSYPTWEVLARRGRFVATRLLAWRPSRFLGEIYAALSLKP